MPIHLTEAQWADVTQGNEVPVRVCDPAESASFVLVKADVYERFKSLFEENPVTEAGAALPASAVRQARRMERSGNGRLQ